MQNNGMSISPLENSDGRVDLVVMDGLVVLKIIKHCQENVPDPVTGQLLGFDENNTLEVTNCYPFAKTSEEEDPGDGTEYQIEMMRCLREVNVEANTVGWYTSSVMCQWVSQLEIQFHYQTEERIRKAVMVVYDPLQVAQGFLSLKAYRLTPNIMELLKTQTFTKESLTKHNVSFNDIYEEIPIRFTNTGLIKAFLYEIEEHRSTQSADFECLDLSSNTYLEKTLADLNETLEDLSKEQNNFTYHQKNLQRTQQQQQAFIQKRKAENVVRKMNGQEPLPETDPTNPIFKPLSEPSRMEYLVITTQIDGYCKQINQFASNNLSKVFLTGSIQKEQ